MKTSNKTNKVTVNQVCNTAVNAVKSAAVNPFFYINSLSKLAKKNDYCDGKAVKPLCDLVMALAKAKGVECRYGFVADLLPRDSRGRFCYPTPRKLKAFALVGMYELPENQENSPIFDYDFDAVDSRFDIKGRDVVTTESGYAVMQPIPFSLTAFANAFKELVRNAESERTAAERAAAKREREQLKAQKAIVAAYNQGVISECEMHAKLAEIA